MNYKYFEIMRLFCDNAELLCVEFCNFEYFNIFVSYLSCYCFKEGVLNITDTNMVARKYLRLYRPIFNLQHGPRKVGSEFSP
jgi:hypothetical protein